MKLVMSEASLDYLADRGFDPVYGARPLKRTLQRELETVMAREILAGHFDNGDTVLVDYVSGADKLDVKKAGDAVIAPPVLETSNERSFE